jgi:flagellar biosynthesis anti-sigma factor FlgM
MKIDSHYTPQPAPEMNRTGPDGTDAVQGSSLVTAQVGEDQAQLSGAHVQVQALAAHASQLPEVRNERVQSLRQSILSGHYCTDPEKLAGALLAHMARESLPA